MPLTVAEEMRRPLYAMSAGELGDHADDVERSLQQVLELSAKWGAVLLIDECDVFLERRSLRDLHRNKIVSVFLRLLEYYQGVMFLTTNRVEDFDPAFESRIHLTINYPKLDPGSRLHIWRTFTNRGAGDRSNIEEDGLAELAKADLNGRQIKNVVRTARLLALRDSAPLTLKHVETVLRVKRGWLGGNASGEESKTLNGITFHPAT
jgi:SpoVK/Ycf46/Vps4 family AAA+-type ATPase